MIYNAIAHPVAQNGGVTVIRRVVSLSCQTPLLLVDFTRKT